MKGLLPNIDLQPIFTKQCIFLSNKPGTAKVGALSKAQNCKKGDPLGFVKFQLVAKCEKKIKGDLWKILEKISNENF